MSRAPHVLVLYGNNIGDRNQAETLARLMGWDYRMLKPVPPKRPRVPVLTEPLPDIIIAVDRRCTDVALQLKRQSSRPVKVIKIGTPYLLGARKLFGERPVNTEVDLYIAYEQYGSGDTTGARMIGQELPFSLIDPAEFDAAKRDYPQLGQLPAPRIAVLVGGRNRYFQWSPEIAAELGRKLNAAADAAGGSLMITTSYRTGPECTAALLAEITVPHEAYRWADGKNANPLRAYLAFADSVVVTMESVAMVADALNAGKPVAVYPLKAKKFEFLKDIVERFMPVSGRTAIIRKLEKSGEISWFGDAPSQPRKDYRTRYAPAVEAARSLAPDAGP